MTMFQSSRSTAKLEGIQKINTVTISDVIFHVYSTLIAAGALPETIRLFTQIYNGIFYCYGVGSDGNDIMQESTTMEV